MLKAFIIEKHSDLGTISSSIDGWRSFTVSNLSVKGKLKLKAFNFLREIQNWERFLAGSMAGGVSQSAIYPLEVS